MKVLALRFFLVLSAFLLSSCGGGRTPRHEISYKTCVFQAGYNYQERNRSRSVNKLYQQAMTLCLEQRQACARNYQSNLCEAFLRKYPR